MMFYVPFVSCFGRRQINFVFLTLASGRGSTVAASKLKISVFRFANNTPTPFSLLRSLHITSSR